MYSSTFWLARVGWVGAGRFCRSSVDLCAFVDLCVFDARFKAGGVGVVGVVSFSHRLMAII